MKRDIVKVPATILRELRSSLNIPLDVAAKKMGVSVDILRSWESGGAAVSVPKARKIASIYKRSWTVLLLNTIPDRSDLSKDYRSFKADYNGFSTKTIMSFRNAEKILYLAELVDGRVTDYEDIESYKVSLSSDIKTSSERIRNWLDMDLSEQKKYKNVYQSLSGWIDKVEAKGLYVSQMKIDPEDRVSAFTISDKKRSVIVLNSDDSVRRRIFSLIHELAHVFLGNGEVFDVFENEEFGSNEKVEVFCNAIAGNVLIPDNVIKKNILNYDVGDIDELSSFISRRYKVSGQVVLRRIFDMGYIDRPFYDFKNKEYTDRYKMSEEKRKKKKFIPGKIHYPRSLAKKHSYALVRDIFEAYRFEKIPYYQMSSLLGVKSKYLPVIQSLIL